MNKPEYHGKYCSGKCQFITGGKGDVIFCTLYGGCVTHCRHEDCIRKHGLDGNQWSKEPPTEPGWYWAQLAKGGTPIPMDWKERMISGGWYGTCAYIRKSIEESEVYMFGPRIQFPELPEGE